MKKYFHAGVDFVVEVEALVSGLFGHVVVELLIGDFVSLFVLAVVG